MKRYFFLLLALVMLAGCQKMDAPNPKGAYTQKYSAEVTTFHPLTARDPADLDLVRQTSAGLVTYDQQGALCGDLAQDWTVNDDHTVWTFTLRPDLHWVDYQGNEVVPLTAQDWVTTAWWVCHAGNPAEGRYLYNDFIVGADEYYRYTAQVQQIEKSDASDFDKQTALDKLEVVKPTEIGVEAVDDTTLVFTLKVSCEYFPSLLANPCFFPIQGEFLVEKGADFGVNHTAILYSGPYRVTSYQPQSHRTLECNSGYWNAPTESVTVELIYADPGDGTDLEPLGDVPLIGDNRVHRDYYAFNFTPKFDAQYHPDNWGLAVQSPAFRQSIGGAMEDAIVALVHKNQAVEELAALGATLPVTLYLPYDPSMPGRAGESLTLERQLEQTLGEDYIDVVVEPRPATDFLAQVQTTGRYALIHATATAPYDDIQGWMWAFGLRYNPRVTAALALTGEEQKTALETAWAEFVDQAYFIPLWS